MKKTILVLVMILFASFLVVGCSKSGSKTPEAEKNGSALERAKRQGYVTVGFANETPYAYTTPDGKITGQAVETARAVLKKLGVKEMKGSVVEFGSLIPGLKANRFDIITAGMFITPERAKEVAFANPEYVIGGALAVRAGNPRDLHSYEDIKKNPKAKVAVMAGSAEAEQLAEVGIPKGQIIAAPDQAAALAALKAGRVDAITMSGPALQKLILTAKDSSIERVKDFTQPIIDGKKAQSYGAAVFRIEDKEFREAYNAELEKMKKSGELLKILKQFGFTEQEFPGDVTAEEVLGQK